MFTQQQYEGTLQENYDLLCRQLDALLEDEPNVMANLANASALLNQFLDRTNWVGFYVMDGEDELVLGPFQGLPACVRIALGKGVCGTAAQTRQTQLVEDVHAFPGHIACDAASRSEVVVPIIVEDRVFGVLDIDSPELARFTEEDARGLEKFVEVLVKHLG
ncbi:Free methionine-R-sulfoxide reductase [Bhargavaea cecembensis DSE10]|uniref:Free methionine-R-sulfoxide reductase n=1 Tax=Bhargavaea cecembensis DSE10 TaxID=1235279 RepID=M7NVP0_9BACL|nr:GAF domain-containing protein [Bhargavaea cecembensis]EMR05720.1 Free methionine-R-sulfoxide reductase [Bhargavaea cecembensis DSE10]